MNPTSTFDAASAAANARGAAARLRRVVDAPMRVFHALFALSFVGAYVTADSEHWRALHVTLGYVFAGLLVFRIVYGLAGPCQARLAALARRAGAALAWWRSCMASVGAGLAARRWPDLPWRQGQAVAMGLAVALLLALALPLAASGIAGHLEWGGPAVAEALEEVHEFFGETMAALVLVHLALVVVLSVLRQRNLARPMWSGRTEGAGPDLVRHDRAWLAVLMVLAVLLFGAWHWRAQAQAQAKVQAQVQAQDRQRGATSTTATTERAKVPSGHDVLRSRRRP